MELGEHKVRREDVLPTLHRTLLKHEVAVIDGAPALERLVALVDPCENLLGRTREYIANSGVAPITSTPTVPSVSVHRRRSSGRRRQSDERTTFACAASQIFLTLKSLSRSSSPRMLQQTTPSMSRNKTRRPMRN